MDRAEALARLASVPVAHLATLTPGLSPHIVPVTFALIGESATTMIDHKPKTTQRLQRLINVEHHPRASLLVDHYSDEWEELWWVRIDGTASVHDGDEFWQASRRALSGKYGQYSDRPPSGPAIQVLIDTVSSWESTP